jgi:predicted dehydrogenase
VFEKSVRFAVVGLGNIARTHVVALRALPVIKQLPYLPVLDTLVTRHVEANREQALAMGFAHVTDSLEEALASRELDVVDICTPNALHLEAARLASAYGKAIYCEKPLADTVERSRILAEGATAGKPHQVALVYRYHPAVIRIRAALQQGLIGDVLQCRASYRRSGYLSLARPISWRMESGLSGGGALTDLGVHVLDLIRHLLGDAAVISGRTHTFVKKRPKNRERTEWVEMEVDDWAQMHLTLASGVEAFAEVSRIAWGAEGFDLEIIGTEGSIVCDLEKSYLPTVKRLDGSTPPLPNPPELALCPDEKTTMGMGVDCHLAALNHFLHRLVGEDRWGSGLAPGLEDCLRAEEWIEQVYQHNPA